MKMKMRMRMPMPMLKVGLWSYLVLAHRLRYLSGSNLCGQPRGVGKSVGITE